MEKRLASQGGLVECSHAFRADAAVNAARFMTRQVETMEARQAMTRPFRSLAFALVLCLIFGLGQASAQSRSQAGAYDQQQSTRNAGGLDEQSNTYDQQNSAGNTDNGNTGATEGYEPDNLNADVQTVPTEGQSDQNRALNSNTRQRGNGPRRAVVEIKPNEFEEFVSKLSGRKIRRFGSEILLPESRDFSAPPTTAVPLDYRINPGDELVIGLTGSVQADNLRLPVDREGRIFLPKVGPVRVGGVPYLDLQGAIASQVARQYRQFRVSVSIGKLHGITVYVTGFAAIPGSYTVSSLSTVVNAVLAAGGPSAGGSFRSIQVKRAGRLVANFDLYDFLLKGDNTADVVLQNGDVIFIAPSGAQVAVIGSVNREAVYEVRAGDSLNDAMLYAGGANTVADLTRLHVLDPALNNGWQELAPIDALSQKATRGQVLRVFSTTGITQPSQRLQSIVTISGEVPRPGRYFVKSGTTLDEVIVMAGGLTPQAYPYGAVFVRDSLRRQQRLNFEKALNELQITLTAQPLTSALARDEDLRYRNSAVTALVDQIRLRRAEGRLVLPTVPTDNLVRGNLVVENNDELFIPSTPPSVGVYGLVNSSADFVFTPGLAIKYYIKLAGGYSRFADRKNLLVIRSNGTVQGGKGVAGAKALPGDLIFVSVDSDRGAFWAKLRDLLSFGFQGALTAAAVVSATK